MNLHNLMLQTDAGVFSVNIGRPTSSATLPSRYSRSRPWAPRGRTARHVIASAEACEQTVSELNDDLIAAQRGRFLIVHNLRDARLPHEVVVYAGLSDMQLPPVGHHLGKI